MFHFCCLMKCQTVLGRTSKPRSFCDTGVTQTTAVFPGDALSLLGDTVFVLKPSSPKNISIWETAMPKTNKINLTDLQVRKAVPKEKAYALIDASGLTLRVIPGGKKIFSWRYRDQLRGNRQCRITYGHYPALSLAQAKQVHSLFSAKRDSGVDVQDPKVLEEIIQQVTQQDVIAARQTGMTFAELVSFFFKEFVEANNKYPGPFNRIKNHTCWTRAIPPSGN